MSGVSAGTVDRVLHNRGDVSVSSREKVQKVLDEPACEFQAKQGISIWGIKLLFFSV